MRLPNLIKIFVINTMKKKAKNELERQDFVDNKIFEMLGELVPANRGLKWNIEVIGAVRDAIETQLIAHGVMTEQQFYPYTRI